MTQISITLPQDLVNVGTRQDCWGTGSDPGLEQSRHSAMPHEQ